jgi:hypothetical protein
MPCEQPHRHSGRVADARALGGGCDFQEVTVHHVGHRVLALHVPAQESVCTHKNAYWLMN